MLTVRGGFVRRQGWIKRWIRFIIIRPSLPNRYIVQVEEPRIGNMNAYQTSMHKNEINELPISSHSHARTRTDRLTKRLEQQRAR